MTSSMIGGDDGDSGEGGFASPPCFMHEVDPAYGGIGHDRQQASDVARWRKAQRERLIAARRALPIEERIAHGGQVAEHLNRLIPFGPSTIVSAYWPFRGEPDLREWLAAVIEKGSRVALPVVVAKGQPLIFREWRPGARLERGVWNIPFPADGEIVAPTVVIAPLVGFDAACYRLGYGGGFFDRTLAAANPKPLAIGVGHPIGAVATIYPQWHDVPMDWIVTGSAPPVQRQ